MRTNPENNSNFLRNSILTGVIVIAIIGILWGMSLSDKNDSMNPNSLALPTQVFATENVPANSPIPSASGDRTNPYTHVIYPSVTPPQGYEDWYCNIIPKWGTSYGSLLVGGPSTYTMSDITAGVIFVNGTDNIPVIVNLNTPPDTWDEVKLVQPGTVGCSISSLH